MLPSRVSSLTTSPVSAPKLVLAVFSAAAATRRNAGGSSALRGRFADPPRAGGAVRWASHHLFPPRPSRPGPPCPTYPASDNAARERPPHRPRLRRGPLPTSGPVRAIPSSEVGHEADSDLQAEAFAAGNTLRHEDPLRAGSPLLGRATQSTRTRWLRCAITFLRAPQHRFSSASSRWCARRTRYRAGPCSATASSSSTTAECCCRTVPP